MAEFKDRLRGLRHERRMTQQELAKAINVTKSTISHWENGDNYPPLSAAIELSKMFGVSLDHLAGRK